MKVEIQETMKAFKYVINNSLGRKLKNTGQKKKKKRYNVCE